MLDLTLQELQSLLIILDRVQVSGEANFRVVLSLIDKVRKALECQQSDGLP